MSAFITSLVNIFSSDIRQAMEFYGNILGLEETYRFPRQGEPSHVEYRVGQATIAISSPEGAASHGLPAPTRGNCFEIGLKTDDVDARIAELRSKSVTILREPFDIAAGNRVAYILDPDGNWISMYHNIRR